jgi:hypothetical protein
VSTTDPDAPVLVYLDREEDGRTTPVWAAQLDIH